MNADFSKEKIKNNIISSVTDLNEEKTLRLVEKALKMGVSMSAVAEYLQQGMDNVGELFEKEEYFIGDLIMAGIIFKEVMKLDKRSAESQKESPGSRGTILIGTIQGDLHDIGKDIFIGLACVNGFNVVDLGVDVPPEVFIEKIREIRPEILGFSGLLRTATAEVKRTLKMIGQEGLRDNLKIIVGGGLMKKEQESPEAYADAYVKNSNRGLEYCIEWAENGYK